MGGADLLTWNCMVEHLSTLRDVLSPVASVQIFSMMSWSVMADEVTGPHGNQQVLSLCLRFVDITDRKSHVCTSSVCRG